MDGAKFDDADAEADDRLELEKRFRIVVGDIGGEDATGEWGTSRENRFVVFTESPASCNDLMRSAILPPALISVPFVLEEG